MFASQKIQSAKDFRILLSQLRRLLTLGQAVGSFKKNSLAGHSSKSGPTAFPTILVFRTTNTQATGKSCFCLRWFITLASKILTIDKQAQFFAPHNWCFDVAGKVQKKKKPPCPPHKHYHSKIAAKTLMCKSKWSGFKTFPTVKIIAFIQSFLCAQMIYYFLWSDVKSAYWIFGNPRRCCVSFEEHLFSLNTSNCGDEKTNNKPSNILLSY